MNTHQKHTYLVLGRGVDPSRLTIGSLVSDPANPQEYHPFIHSTSEADLIAATGQPQKDKDCSLSFNATHGWLVSLDLLGLLEGHSKKDSNYNLKVKGKNGLRHQLNEPEEFLNKVVLRSPVACEWIVSRLSVNRAMALAAHVRSRLAGLWMVTGIQQIDGGKIVLGSSSEASTGVGITVPIPDPAGGGVMTAASGGPGAMKLKGEVKGGGGTGNDYTHEDSRVWAAQFMRLKPSLKREVQNETTGEFEKWVKLRDLVDLGRRGVRADHDGSEEENDDDDDDGDQQGESVGKAAPDEYVLVEDTKVQEYDSADLIDADIMEYSASVDWTQFAKYLKQAEAKSLDESL